MNQDDVGRRVEHIQFGPYVHRAPLLLLPEEAVQLRSMLSGKYDFKQVGDNFHFKSRNELKEAFRYAHEMGFNGEYFLTYVKKHGIIDGS